MIEAEWWDYEDADELADAVAGDIGFIIESAIDARGSCVLALAGGKTPLHILKKLADQPQDWKRVVIIPTDERIVPLDDPLSNARMLASIFLPKGARVIPIISEKAADYRLAGSAAASRLGDLHWPPDLVWLGAGSDGHCASIFNGPDLEDALHSPARAVGVMPDPLPAEAPVPRVTLTRSALASAKSLMIVCTGETKKAMLEQALRDGDSSPLPVGRVLAGIDLPVDIHWCP